MHGGYILDFSDRTFTQFFSEELSINIDDPRYAKEGESKAKRLPRARAWGRQQWVIRPPVAALDVKLVPQDEEPG